MSNSRSVNTLLKTNSQDNIKKEGSLDNSRKYQYTKQQMRGLCDGFSVPSREYESNKMIEAIEDYLNEQDKLDRILYSEISNYIFELNDSQRGNFLTNIEQLLIDILEKDNSVSIDIRKIVLKIYDHVQLVTYQVENSNKIFEKSILDVKSKLHDEIKGIEREYVTILGIFASIVLAFVGGITFSTSVLQNIDKVSIYRLILIVDAIGMILINIIYLLISFILKINDKEDDNSLFLKNVNKVLFGIVIIVIICWVLNITELQGYLNKIIWHSK